MEGSSSFQITVKNNYAIAIATLSDWLKNLALVFQPMRSKTNRNLYVRFSCASSKLQAIAGNSEWFTALSSYDFAECLGWYWFFDSRLKTATLTKN